MGVFCRYLRDSRRVAFNDVCPRALLGTLWLVCLREHCLSFSPAASTGSESGCNFEWFHQKTVPKLWILQYCGNIDVISSPSLFPHFALFLPNCSCISVCLWTHTIYILCTWDSPEYLAGLSWSTNAEQSKKDFKTVFSLIFFVLVTPNLVKLVILVMASTFFLLIISLRSFPSNMLALL